MMLVAITSICALEHSEYSDVVGRWCCYVFRAELEGKIDFIFPAVCSPSLSICLALSVCPSENSEVRCQNYFFGVHFLYFHSPGLSSHLCLIQETGMQVGLKYNRSSKNPLTNLDLLVKRPFKLTTKVIVVFCKL